MLLDGAVSLCEFLVEASFSGSGCGALISCLCTKRVALSRSPSEDLLCLFWSSFIYLFTFLVVVDVDVEKGSSQRRRQLIPTQTQIDGSKAKILSRACFSDAGYVSASSESSEQPGPR